MFSTRYRILIGRLVAALALAFMFFSHPPRFFSSTTLEFFELFGLILLCSAAIGRIWCSFYITDKKNSQLVAHGPYSIVRNPLYVFSFLGIVGFGMTVENPLLALLLGTVFVVYYTGVIKKEERALAGFFGDTYINYMATTPRWIPNFRLYTEPQTVAISPGKVRRDILDATWFIWLFVLWECVEIYRG